MTCYYPLKGYRAKEPGPNGKRKIVFNFADGYVDLPIKVPCGQCIGCRLERSRQWALRCKYEAQLHDNNCFITLTYSDEHLPDDYSVDVRVFQLFMKRLRKKYGSDIRFFHCGEYGEKYGRPHYHAILFNMDFDDKILLKIVNGQRIYTSDALLSLWPYGFNTVGDVTFQSAAYVARYCLKKLTGPDSEKAYDRIHPVTGELVRVKPEYATMSRRPGIGTAWFKNYKRDVYPHDYVVHDGQKMRPPKFFDGLFEHDNPKEFGRLKGRRMSNARKHEWNNTSERLRVRETVKEAQISQLKRGLDNDL